MMLVHDSPQNLLVPQGYSQKKSPVTVTGLFKKLSLVVVVTLVVICNLNIRLGEFRKINSLTL